MTIFAKIGIRDEERERLCDQLLEVARAQKSRGMSTENIIRMLHARGLSIVQSTWVLVHVEHMSLDQAKAVVTAHPVWEELVRETEPLHEELIKAITEDADCLPSTPPTEIPASAAPQVNPMTRTPG